MNKDAIEALEDICKYFRAEEYKNAESLCQTKISRHKYYSRMANKCETIRTALERQDDTIAVKREDVPEGLKNLIAEIDLTLDYFVVEFPEDQFPQVWNDPISHYSGGISPNDLLKIKAALLADKGE